MLHKCGPRVAVAYQPGRTETSGTQETRSSHTSLHSQFPAPRPPSLLPNQNIPGTSQITNLSTSVSQDTCFILYFLVGLSLFHVSCLWRYLEEPHSWYRWLSHKQGAMSLPRCPQSVLCKLTVFNGSQLLGHCRERLSADHRWSLGAMAACLCLDSFIFQLSILMSIGAPIGPKG